MYPVLRLLLSALALNCLSTPYTTSPAPSTTAVRLPHLADRLRGGPLELEDELYRNVGRDDTCARILDLASPGVRRDSSDMSGGSTRGLWDLRAGEMSVCGYYVDVRLENSETSRSIMNCCLS